MIKEALGSPQSWVVVAREEGVGEGRACVRVARAARERWWRGCIVAVVVGSMVGFRVIIRLWFWQELLLRRKCPANNDYPRDQDTSSM